MRWGEDGGLQSRYVTSIDIDQFGTLWTAHSSRTAVDGATIEKAGGVSIRTKPIGNEQTSFVSSFPEIVLPFLPCYPRNAEAVACGLGSTWLVTRESDPGCSVTTAFIWSPPNLLACAVCPDSWTYDLWNTTEISVIVTDENGCSAEDTFLLRVDRWGECVYAAEILVRDNPGSGWNGACKGEKAAPGVYVYWAEIEYVDGETEIVKGDVTLLR